MKLWSFLVSALQFCNAQQQLNGYSVQEGIDVKVRGQSQLLDRRVVSTLTQCEYYCKYNQACNTFSFSDRNTGRAYKKPNCWIKFLHPDEPNQTHQINYRTHRNVYFYRKQNSSVEPYQPQQQQMTRLDYTCANGNQDCITHRPQANGNFLCRVTHTSYDEALTYCNRVNCDGIIDNGEVDRRYEAVRNARNGQGCQVPQSLANQLVYTPVNVNSGPNLDSYVCPGGRSDCVSSSRQRHGNILCDTTHKNLEEAQYYCDIFNCDAIITDGRRWEAVNLVSRANGCTRSNQVNVQVVFKRNSNNYGRGKRSEPVIVHTSRVIEGHGPTAFKQRETHFKEANVTVYNVDPHLKYERNYQVDFHNEEKSVGVTPTKCVLLFQSTKYNLDSALDSTTVTKDNSKTTKMNFQFVPSGDAIFESKFLSVLCKGKELLEEDYMIPETAKNGSNFIITEGDKIKREVDSRSKRHTVYCAKSMCSGLMYTQCNDQDCTGGGMWCLYLEDEGTTGVRIHSSEFKKYNHIQVQDMWCMPCCHSTPTYWRMPKCKQISRARNLCQWYDSKGRCGDNFGAMG